MDSNCWQGCRRSNGLAESSLHIGKIKCRLLLAHKAFGLA